VSDALCFLSIAEAGRRMRAGTLTSVALTEAFLSRIAAIDSRLSSYLLVTAEGALDQAKAADRQPPRGPLHGIPLALKDNIETAGIRTTAHSKILADHVPKKDAVVVDRLRDAGAVLLGKLSLHEFAGSGPAFDLPWPPARNPWNPDLGPGGSSSGAGVAVAAGLAMGALGTDTAGSIRIPASLCGLFGLKPTYDLVSREGVIPHSFSLDHVGPLAWTAEDCALVLGAIAGGDYAANLNGGVKGLRIGLVRHFHEEEQRADDAGLASVATAVETLRRLGATVEDVRLMPLRDYADCRSLISRAEDYAVLEADLKPRLNDFGARLRNTLPSAGMIRAVDYIQAQRQRLRLARHMAEVLRRYDALLTANHYGIVPLDGAGEAGGGSRLGITSVANVTGNPALSIPLGMGPEGLPRAVQVIGRANDEALVLRIGQAIDAAQPTRRRPDCGADRLRL
jgi:aspartyl-tRNA(Asn)/glutamyl-tRNA(Gln) amidotransferase subunit A